MADEDVIKFSVLKGYNFGTDWQKKTEIEGMYPVLLHCYSGMTYVFYIKEAERENGDNGNGEDDDDVGVTYNLYCRSSYTLGESWEDEDNVVVENVVLSYIGAVELPNKVVLVFFFKEVENEDGDGNDDDDEDKGYALFLTRSYDCCMSWEEPEEVVDDEDEQ